MYKISTIHKNVGELTSEARVRSREHGIRRSDHSLIVTRIRHLPPWLGISSGRRNSFSTLRTSPNNKIHRDYSNHPKCPQSVHSYLPISKNASAQSTMSSILL